MRDSIASRELPAGEIHLHWLARPAGSGRQALKKVLAPYLGVSWQAVVVDQSDSSSKPYLSGGGSIRFNWSHSAEWALVAVARGLEVGVDLEARERSVRSLALAARFFADSEYRYLRSLPVGQRANAFFRLWTGKEAVLKALGRGISDGLDRVELAICASGDLEIWRLGLSGLPGEPVHLQALQVPFEHACAALAWAGQPQGIRTFYHGRTLAAASRQTAVASWQLPVEIRA